MPSQPLDTVYAAISAANVRLNNAVETLVPVGGQIAGNTNSFSQQLVNQAWRKFQAKLADLRYSGLQTETVLLSIPACTNTDTAVQVYIGYDGYFDGTNLQPNPILPQTLLRPYEMSERVTNSASQFFEMDLLTFTLPRVPKKDWNAQWIWRANAIYMPGALAQTDIAMTFAQLLSDFLDAGATAWFQQTMPIINCLDAMADYICCEIKIAQGQMEGAVAFQASADDKAALIVNRDSTSGKSILKQSNYGMMQDRFTPNSGADTQPVKR